MRHHIGSSTTHARRAGPLAGALAALGLLIAACSSGSGSPGVASLSPSSGGSGSQAPGKADPIAYSQCMRAHGVKDFPDPDAQGRIQIRAQQGSDMAPDSPVFKAAQQACKSLAPTQSAQQQQQQRDAMLKYAQCMRSHGIKDFPDPNSQGGLLISAAPGGDLDPNSPQFKAAQEACKSYAPGGGPGGGESGKGI